MADDPTVITPIDAAAAQKVKDLADATAKAAKGAKEQVSDLFSATEKLVGTLTGKSMNAMKAVFSSSINLTKNEITSVNGLSAAALGASKSFETLNSKIGLDLDEGQLNSYNDQLNSVLDSTRALGKGGEAIAKGIAGIFGINLDKSINGIGSIAAAIETRVGVFLKAADSAKKFELSILSSAAASGTLGQVLSHTGNNLEKVNDYLSNQSVYLDKVAKSTGMSIENVTKYYFELYKIPGAINDTVDSQNIAIGRTDLLSTTLKAAIGTGRSFQSVLKDLETGWVNYAMSGEQSLMFATRISDLSQTLSLRLSDVESFMTETALSFKMFGNEAEGSARILNRFLKSFTDTGISSPVAVDIVKNMTHSIKDLNIAQKSFLSSQTGGPGGLMGGYQIEKMLRDGKIDEVFEKVRGTLKKQFGSIVTLDEASKDENSANMLTKQATILKQGPLGSFARTDQEAYRILEALKNEEKFPVSELKAPQDALQDAVNRGNSIHEKNNTALMQIKNALESQKMQGSIASKKLVEGNFTAAGNEISPNTDPSSKQRRNLKAGMEEGSKEAAIASQKSKDDYINFDAMAAMKNFTQAADTIKDTAFSVGDLIKTTTDGVKNLFQIGSEKDDAGLNKLGIDIDRIKNGLKIVDKNKDTKNEDKSEGSSGFLSKIFGTKKERDVQDNNNNNNNKNEKEKVEITIKGFCLNCAKELAADNHSKHSKINNHKGNQ